jgi:alpha-glucosidase (family GH31 glycosyl hydrolase)
VDFWWLDWQQNLTSNYTDGLGETFWCNHVFFNDMRNNRPDRRPIIFHRWGGLGSHRYPIGFSGDTYSTFGSLAFQPYFTATASNVCFGYWGHDLGGHIQIAPTNSELMLRWLQFGVFSPIFRTHGSSQEGNERRIWKFDNFPMLLDCVRLRYELLPYIYTAARQAYDTGISICRPLYYEWPEENEAYRQEGEYLFGDDILVSPIVTAANGEEKTYHKTWLPEGSWYDACRNEMIQGGTTISQYYGLTDIPYFIKAGSIVVCNPPMMNLKKSPDLLIAKVVPGERGETVLYEDEGDTQGYAEGAFATTTFSQARSSSELSLTIAPRQGAYPEMPQERAYQIVFLLEEMPCEVSINGTSTDDWSYDDTMKQVIVNVPSMPCEQQIVVTLQRATSGISQIGDATIISQQYFDLQGREYTYPPQGTYLFRRTWSNGKVSTQKYIR